MLNLNEILTNALLLCCQIWGSAARQNLASETFDAFLLIPEAGGAVSLSQR